MRTKISCTFILFT